MATYHDGGADDRTVCPFCRASGALSDARSCPHRVCLGLPDGTFAGFASAEEDFSAEVAALARGFAATADAKYTGHIFTVAATEKYGDLSDRIIGGPAYWSLSSRVVIVEDPRARGGVKAYFHPSPTFPRWVKTNARRMLRWLDEHQAGYIDCPVCGRRINPGMVKVCRHYLGTDDSGSFIDLAGWTDGFMAEVGRLVEQLADAGESDRFEALLADAPADVRDLLERVGEEGETYWVDRTVRVPWEEIGFLSSGGGDHHFVYDRKDFATEVEEECRQGIGWIAQAGGGPTR